MITKVTYLNRVEDAYREVSQAGTTVGLHLTPPFPRTERGATLAIEIRGEIRELEEKLRELYRVENDSDAW